MQGTLDRRIESYVKMLTRYNPDSTSFKLLYLFFGECLDDFDYLNNLKILTPEVDLLKKLTIFTNSKKSGKIQKKDHSDFL